MAKLYPSEYLIDTGGIDLFVEPPDGSILNFWKESVRQKEQHTVCDIVYWEFLRKYGPKDNDVKRQRFLSAIKQERLLYLPFDQYAADIAIHIYQGVHAKLDGSKKQKRARMNELQCDIIIASIAVRNRKIVITDDIKDWSLLRDIIHTKELGTLPLITKDDMRDPSRWKGK